MKHRRFLLFLLGAWIGATLFMWLVATQNFAVAHRLLEGSNAEFAAKTAPLGDETLRDVLRYQASEVNRLFFAGWGWVQLPLGALCLWLTVRVGGRWRIAVAGLLFTIVLVLGLYVVPETVRLGRLLDFVPRDPAPLEAAAFWRLHSAYTSLDMIKMLGALGLALVLWRKE